MRGEHAKSDPTELTRRVVASAAGADIGAVADLCGAHTVWDVHPWGLGTHRGAEAIARFLAGWIEAFDEYEIVVEELRDHGGGVVLAIVTQHATPARSPSRLALRSASLFVWTDGVLDRVTHYRDLEEGRTAAERVAAERARAPASVELVPLDSIADRARARFRAQACSIMVHRPESRSLEFAAVSGEGADTLPGLRIRDTTGFAGVVLGTGEPMFVDEVGSDRRFAEEIAEAFGYVPKRIIAIPLMLEARALGVLEILDGIAAASLTGDELEQLGDFARQAARTLAADVLAG